MESFDRPMLKIEDAILVLDGHKAAAQATMDFATRIVYVMKDANSAMLKEYHDAVTFMSPEQGVADPGVIASLAPAKHWQRQWEGAAEDLRDVDGHVIAFKEQVKMLRENLAGGAANDRVRLTKEEDAAYWAVARDARKLRRWGDDLAAIGRQANAYAVCHKTSVTAELLNFKRKR